MTPVSGPDCRWVTDTSRHAACPAVGRHAVNGMALIRVCRRRPKRAGESAQPENGVCLASVCVCVCVCV